MFDIEREVPSLELCRKLKELGYPQTGGGWYWIEEDGKCILVFSKDGNSYIYEYNEGEYLEATLPENKIKAPTVRELGEWLPAKINPDEMLWIGKSYKWCIAYGLLIRHSVVFEEEKEADARAKMLIWLRENGYLYFGEDRENKEKTK